MFRLIRCTVLHNSQITKKQCTVFASGYHCTPVLNGDSLTVGKWIKTQSEPYQPVADFYAGRSIFLTGGTGFLGKVFVERLLSTCSDIEKIYILIRPKKGAPVEQRLQDLLENPIFTFLKSTKPDYLKKVVAIAGDLTEPGLGIKPEDEQTLIDKVSVVFHSAADVKFSEPLQTSLDINFEGTRKVMNLGKQMRNMEIFVHISTTFSNSDRLVIEERLYPPPAKVEDVNRFVKAHGNDEEEIEKFLGGFLNCYCFSKALAESLLMEQHGDMRTVIVRPSIVGPIFGAPVPGWLDSWVASTGTFSDVSQGLTRIIYGNKEVVIDLIPVDFVCNLAIIAAAKSPKTDDIPVYHSCSGSSNPITWVEATNLFVKNSGKLGYAELPMPKVFTSDSPVIVAAGTFLLQTVPSFIADVLLRITGRKPKYMKLQRRAVVLRDILKSISSANILKKSDRAEELMSLLDEKDRQKFICDPRIINWKEYMTTYCYGVKRYLLRK